MKKKIITNAIKICILCKLTNKIFFKLFFETSTTQYRTLIILFNFLLINKLIITSKEFFIYYDCN